MNVHGLVLGNIQAGVAFRGPERKGETMSETDQVPLELQGFFPDDGTLNAALERLQDAGFHRGDLSPPEEHPHWGEQPESDPKNSLVKDEDSAQLRTLATGMAGYAGAAAVAAATIATGGATALAVGVAAATGVGTAALATTAGHVAEDSMQQQHNDLAAEGRLVLGVRTANATDAARARQILEGAGAVRINPIYEVIDATTAGVSSASWTG